MLKRGCRTMKALHSLMRGSMLEEDLTIKAIVSGVDSVFKKEFFASHVYSGAAMVKKNCFFRSFIYAESLQGNEDLLRTEVVTVDLNRFHNHVPGGGGETQDLAATDRCATAPASTRRTSLS